MPTERPRQKFVPELRKVFGFKMLRFMWGVCIVKDWIPYLCWIKKCVRCLYGACALRESDSGPLPTGQCWLMSSKVAQGRQRCGPERSWDTAVFGPKYWVMPAVQTTFTGLGQVWAPGSVSVVRLPMSAEWLKCAQVVCKRLSQSQGSFQEKKNFLQKICYAPAVIWRVVLWVCGIG